VSMKTRRRVSVSVSQETKGLLDSIKHRGQSYDGLLHELAMRWQKAKEIEVKKGNPGNERTREAGNAGNMNRWNQAD
jgi:hypothetical protein